MGLASILDHAARLHGAKMAVRCGSLQWSYADLVSEARSLASGLARLGMEPGDRVAIVHRNCHRFMRVALGAAAGGFVLVPCNTRLDAASIAEQLRDSGARWLLTEGPLRELAEAAGGASGVDVRDVDDVRGDPGRCPSPTASEHDVAQLYYTSGTTGRPRGVMLTHRNIASHALMTIAELSLSERDIWAHIAPMFHLADAWAVFAITWAGGRHVMFPDFDPPIVLQGLEREGVTITNLVPTMWNRLVHEPVAEERPLASLRCVLSGGAPIAPSLVSRMMRTFRAEYVQTYGLTETSPYLTFSLLTDSMRKLPEEEQMRIRCRTGRPALGVELRIVDDDFRDLPRDDASVGEVVVRAPWVTPGYWNRPEETRAAFRDGWFLTGDLATWDASGSVNIVDRKRDMIITGGEKVFSVEVERALAAHPLVFECAVVGASDPDWGERVSAVVVLRPGHRVAHEEIVSFLCERLASFKIPKETLFVEALPRTGSGKIRKAELRERLARGRLP